MRSIPIYAFALCALLLTDSSSTRSAWARERRPTPVQQTESKDDAGCRECVAKAASMFAAHDSLGAAKLLQEWRPKCPGNVQLRLLLSTILVRLGQRGQEAEDTAAEAVKINPHSLAASLQYALTLEGNGHTMLAIAQFDKVIELDPSSYEAWSSLGKLYNDMHEQEKSEMASKKAASLDPSIASMRARQLRSLERSGRFEDIKAELIKLLSAEDVEPEACLDIAEQALNFGAFAEGIRACDKALNSYPKSVKAMRIKALCQLFNNQLPESIDTSQQWLKLDAKAGDAHAISGLAQLKLGQMKDAEINLKLGAAATPATVLTHLCQAELDLLAGNVKDAEAKLRKAIAVQNNLAPAHLRLAQLCWMEGKLEEAMAEAREAGSNCGLKARASSLEASIKMADQSSKDTQIAGQQMAYKTIAAGMNSPEALLAEASFYLTKNKPIQAKPALDRLLAAQPGDEQAQFFVFKMAKAVGNIDLEKQALEKCFELSPGDPEVLAAQAELAMTGGDVDRAVELYKKSLANRAEAPTVCLDLAKALEKKGDADESIKYYKLCLSSGPNLTEQAQANDALKRLGGKTK